MNDEKEKPDATPGLISRCAIGCLILFILPLGLFCYFTRDPRAKANCWTVHDVPPKVMGLTLDQVEEKYGPGLNAFSYLTDWDRMYYLCHMPTGVDDYWLVIRLDENDIVIAADAVND